MSQSEEKLFQELVPLKSALGREFLALQANREKEKMKFEQTKDKMGYDTTPYRYASLALDRFLQEWIPRVQKANESLGDGARLRLETHEKSTKNWNSIHVDRRSERIIWTRFAIERYYDALPKARRKQIRIYDPHSWHELREKWRAFRTEVKRWQSGSAPFDGSQAMHNMLDFQVLARVLACRND